MKLHISCRVICFNAGFFCRTSSTEKRVFVTRSKAIKSSFFFLFFFLFIFSIIFVILEVSEIRNEKSSSLKYSGHWKASFVYGKGFLSSSSSSSSSLLLLSCFRTLDFQWNFSTPGSLVTTSLLKLLGPF